MNIHRILYLALFTSIMMSCDDDTSEFGLSNTFIKLYGDANTNTGVKAIQTDDDGYFVTGYTDFGNNVISTEVFKTNALGNVEWSSVLDTANLNVVKDIMLDDDGGFILLIDQFELNGNTVSKADIVVKKLTATGTVLNTFIFDSDGIGTYNESGNGITKTADGGYVLIGTTDNTAGGSDTDMYVLRLDASFALVWDKIYGNVNGLNDAGTAILEDENGDLVWLGIEEVSIANSRARMVKTNSLGNILWDFNYPVVESNTIIGGTSTVGDFINLNNNYIFTGSHSRRGVILVSVDSNGQEVWFKQFTSDGGEEGRDVTLGTDNTLVIAGSSGGVNPNMLLLKADIQGNLIWRNTFGDAGLDEANSIEPTSDGGLVFVGDTFFDGTRMISLTKTNQNGETSQ